MLRWVIPPAQPRDPVSLTVLALVKNVYDADARAAVVRIDMSSGQNQRDEGNGMSLELLRSVWLVPGDDHRHRQRAEGRRILRHHRPHSARRERGRFAVRKLETRIEVNAGHRIPAGGLPGRTIRSRPPWIV